jgi:hypothetical protein
LVERCGSKTIFENGRKKGIVERWDRKEYLNVRIEKEIEKMKLKSILEDVDRNEYLKDKIENEHLKMRI